jgi:hypothetical protein
VRPLAWQNGPRLSLPPIETTSRLQSEQVIAIAFCVHPARMSSHNSARHLPRQLRALRLLAGIRFGTTDAAISANGIARALARLIRAALAPTQREIKAGRPNYRSVRISRPSPRQQRIPLVSNPEGPAGAFGQVLVDAGLGEGDGRIENGVF